MQPSHSKILALVGFSALVTACSSGAITAFAPAKVAISAPGRPISSGHLYVANAHSVSVYSFGKAAPDRVITKGITAPTAMIMDHGGTLYVANVSPATGKSTISVYAPGTDRPFRTITHGIDGPSSLALDLLGNLYVANIVGGTVTLYDRTTGKLEQTLSKGLSAPRQLAFDSDWNLYVLNTGKRQDVAVFTPQGRPSRTISTGTTLTSIAIDRRDSLYIASFGPKDGAVTVYGFGSRAPARTITAGIDGPDVLAFDDSGNLYVANIGTGAITVYSPENSDVLRTITQGLDGPTSLAFSFSGDLYSANCACAVNIGATDTATKGSVTAYKRNGTALTLTISKSVDHPHLVLSGP